MLFLKIIIFGVTLTYFCSFRVECHQFTIKSVGKLFRNTFVSLGFMASTSASQLTHAIDYKSLPESVVVQNRKLFDVAFGTISTMFYDSTNENHGNFVHSKAWRNSWKSIIKHEDEIFNSNAATEEVIRNLVKLLPDHYSLYASPQEYSPNNKFGKSVSVASNSKASLGISIKPYLLTHGREYKLNGAEVVAVYADSACERAGLHVGDVIVEINGKKLQTLSVKDQRPTWATLISTAPSPDESTELIENIYEDCEKQLNSLVQGDLGSTVKLGIIPRNRALNMKMDRNALDSKVYHVAIRRDFQMKPVFNELTTSIKTEDLRDPAIPGETVAYVRLRSFRFILTVIINISSINYINASNFSPATSEELVSVLSSTTVRRSSMLLIDLRNNYGGVIQDALLDASLFLDDEPNAILCYTQSSNMRYGLHYMKSIIYRMNIK